jgi:hypothetical protein
MLRPSAGVNGVAEEESLIDLLEDFQRGQTLEAIPRVGYLLAATRRRRQLIEGLASLDVAPRWLIDDYRHLLDYGPSVLRTWEESRRTPVDYRLEGDLRRLLARLEREGTQALVEPMGEIGLEESSRRSKEAPEPTEKLPRELDKGDLEEPVDVRFAQRDDLDIGFPSERGAPSLPAGEPTSGDAGSSGGEPPDVPHGRAGDSGPGAPNPPPRSRPLRMTPHLDVAPDPPLLPGKKCRVEVFADQGPGRKGETVQPIELLLPPNLKRLALTTRLLVSDHFKIVGPMNRLLPVEVGKSSTNRIGFELRVRTQVELRKRFPKGAEAGRGLIAATFEYRGRPSGSVSREVDIVLSGRTRRRAPAAAPRPATIRVDVDAELADLVVRIRSVSRTGRDFSCKVSTRLVRFPMNGKWVKWTLNDRAEQIVRGFMAGFVNDKLPPRGRVGELRGAGVQLFKAAPTNFIRVYWDIVDKKKPLRTIAIVSEEPFFPWELMVPRRGKGKAEETLEPLGVQYAIGRYTTLDDTSGPQRFPLRRSLVLAPRYKKHALKRAEPEATMVLAKVDGDRLQPAVIDSLLDALKRAPPHLVHFIGHGEDDKDRMQSLLLEQDQRLRASAVAGLAEIHEAFTKTSPLLVLNACEVGGATPALRGAGGLAQALIDRGAGGVVAALWSVADEPAHEVARVFYEEALKDPPKSFAEILRGIRKRAYEGTELGEDTYAAYCYYGDPHARRE